MEGYQIQENIQKIMRNRKSLLTCIFKLKYMQIYSSENPLKRVKNVWSISDCVVRNCSEITSEE